MSMHDSYISRRDLLKAGGALIVSFAFARGAADARRASARRRQRAADRSIPARSTACSRFMRTVRHPLHEQGRRRNRHAHRARADGRRRARRLAVARHGRRGRHGHLSGSGRNGRKHRPRFAAARKSGRRRRPRDARCCRLGADAAESSGCGLDDRRRRGATAGGRRGRRHRHRSSAIDASRSRSIANAPLTPAIAARVDRQAAASARRAGQVHRTARLRPGLHAARHAARPRRPASGDRRNARLGG